MTVRWSQWTKHSTHHSRPNHNLSHPSLNTALALNQSRLVEAMLVQDAPINRFVSRRPKDLIQISLL